MMIVFRNTLSRRGKPALGFGGLLLAVLYFLFFIPAPLSAGHTTSLSVGPSAGVFTVGSTFNISFFLHAGESVNAIDLVAQFPPDKLQLVSPSTGKSIIGIWTDQPTFDNRTGSIHLQGIVPNGIVTDNGVVTTLSFRVIGTGSAVMKVLNTSQVLAHDGSGSDILENVESAVYTLVLPPPAGPLVVSETHPDQSRWYPVRSSVLGWEPYPGASGYSFHVSDTPVDIPDNVSNGTDTHVLYRDLGSGVHYFHLKALRGGVWGGTTHYALRIDAEPPAEFSVGVRPEARTTRRQPVLEFFTTDTLSGISHYEVKIIPVSLSAAIVVGAGVEEAADGRQSLFVEASSPYILPLLEIGSYDVIVRAYDVAGNYREVIERIDVVTPLFRLASRDGLEVFGVFTIPWVVVLIVAFLLTAGVGVGAWYLKRLHERIHERRIRKELPQKLDEEIAELKKYRDKYGTLSLLALLISGTLFFSGFGGVPTALAQESSATAVLAPPLVTTLSAEISNSEIFYVGGRTDASQINVTIFLQSIESGETFQRTVSSDVRGEWFYSHGDFLPSGNYLLWTQASIGEEVSPPSPQKELTVRQTAIQFGSSRISYEVLYFLTSIVLLLITLVLAAYGVVHGYHARRKHKELSREIREAEESVRRGFAVLRRDIEAEIRAHRETHKGREPSEEEQEREGQLLKDLEWAEQYIGKEVWDVADADRND